MMNKILEVCKDNVTTLAAGYCTAYNGRTMKDKQLKAAKKAAMDAVSVYNAQLAKFTYASWNENGNVVLSAISQRYIPKAMRISFRTSESGVMGYELTYSSEFLKADLHDIHEQCGADKFANPRWYDVSFKLCYLIGNRISYEISDEADAIYNDIVDTAKEFKFPDGINPLSDKGIIMALQMLFDAICFVKDEDGSNRFKVDCKESKLDGRIYSNTWSSIREWLTKKGKGTSSTEICSLAKFTEFVVDAMHTVYSNDSKFTIGVKD